jgi:hypothetical protein
MNVERTIPQHNTEDVRIIVVFVRQRFIQCHTEYQNVKAKHSCPCRSKSMRSEMGIEMSGMSLPVVTEKQDTTDTESYTGKRQELGARSPAV